jgi:hypothetical protein
MAMNAGRAMAAVAIGPPLAPRNGRDATRRRRSGRSIARRIAATSGGGAASVVTGAGVQNLVLVVVCLAVGAILRASRRVPDATPQVLNRVVLDVALPALVLHAIHDLGVDPSRPGDVAAPAIAPWVALALAAALLAAATRALRRSRAELACLVLTAGFANTSFVGFPLVEALYGPDGLRHAVLADQSSFLMVASVGTIVAAVGSGGARPSARAVAARVASFPPFAALILAIVLRPFPLPALVAGALDRLGALVVPLALLSVGFQLRVDRASLARHGRALALGLAVRLALVPLAVAIGLRALGARGLAADVTIVELAMAPMITSALLAIEAGLEPELATLMVGVGVPVSLVTVPAWAWILRAL